MNAINNFKDLRAWQLGMELAVTVYRETEKFPLREHFGLSAQLRKSAVSVPSNVAEGHNRRMRAPYRNHVSIALGSAGELETQIEIGRRLGLFDDRAATTLIGTCVEVGRVLQGLFGALRDERDQPLAPST